MEDLYKSLLKDPSYLEPTSEFALYKSRMDQPALFAFFLSFKYVETED